MKNKEIMMTITQFQIHLQNEKSNLVLLIITKM